MKFPIPVAILSYEGLPPSFIAGIPRLPDSLRFVGNAFMLFSCFWHTVEPFVKGKTPVLAFKLIQLGKSALLIRFCSSMLPSTIAIENQCVVRTGIR